MALTVCAFSLGSARIVRLIGVRRAFIGSLLSCVVGLVIMLNIGVDSGLRAYLIGSAIAGIGYGLSFSLVSDVAVGSVPTERAGAATGVSETSFELGQALGLALLGSLAAVVFSRIMSSDGTAFRGTLGDAVTAAADDPALIETAKSAYVTGVHASLGTAAVILAVTATVAAVVLPRKSSAASAE
jgi:DHA2 family multidrug resistance protein-like MFS transporter